MYFGFELLKNNGKLFRLASPEKAFLDLFYIKTELREDAGFAGLRINREVFLKLMDRGRMNEYLGVYAKKSLKHRIDSFWEYIRNA